MTVIDYNGSDAAMNDLLDAPVDWPEPPADTIGWSESTSISMGGGVTTKTSTRTYYFADGHEET